MALPSRPVLIASLVLLTMLLGAVNVSINGGPFVAAVPAAAGVLQAASVVDAVPPSAPRVGVSRVTAVPSLSKGAAAESGVQGKWGYASERNAQRWAVIGPALVDHLGARGVMGAAGATHLASDYGADQGFFTVALALLLQRAGARDGGVFAVEKGGIGGTLWARRGSKLNVHDKIFDAAAFNNVTEHVELCPVEVKAATFRAMVVPPKTAARHSEGAPEAGRWGVCRVEVQLLLSMLHWVTDMNSAAEFRRGICAITAAARLTVLELPNPNATGTTFGVKRYAQWYKGHQRNATAALLAAVESCDGDGLGRRTLRLLGRTPWGSSYRELHAVSFVPAAADAAENTPEMRRRCAAALKCVRHYRTRQPASGAKR
jgi:hypothetical protein